MPIYMKYAGIEGESEVRGKKGWIELQSFAWGLSRATAAAKAGTRGDAQFSASQVTITRQADSISAMLMQEAAIGSLDHDIEIAFLRTGANKKPTAYMEVKLRTAGLSSYSISGAGEVPVETMTISFDAIEMTSMQTNDALHSVPTTASLDVSAGRGI